MGGGERGTVDNCPHHRPHSSQVVRGLSAGARVFEYMTLHPSILLSGGCCIPRDQLRGAISFQGVSFRSVIGVWGEGVGRRVQGAKWGKKGWHKGLQEEQEEMGGYREQ